MSPERPCMWTNSTRTALQGLRYSSCLIVDISFSDNQMKCITILCHVLRQVKKKWKHLSTVSYSWESVLNCGAAVRVMKLRFNVVQFDTICSIWRNSRINTRRMSLAMTESPAQRVLWKLWHDKQATPIIFQTASRNITALLCAESYKAQGHTKNNNIKVM